MKPKSYNIMPDSQVFDGQSVDIVCMSIEHHSKSALHSHEFYEIVYIDKGFALHMCNGVSTVVTSGDLFIMRPGDVHAYISTSNTNLYNCLFTAQALQGMWQDILDLPGMQALFSDKDYPWRKLSLDMSERREVLSYLNRIYDERLNRGIGWELNLKARMLGFLVFYARMLARRIDAHAGEGSHVNQVYRALDTIASQYAGELSVAALAARSGLSSDYFARQFKNVLGVPPNEYIKNYRVAMAMEKLRNTKKSTAVVARESGFGDISHFSRQFKAVVGITPSAFRRQEQ